LPACQQLWHDEQLRHGEQLWFKLRYNDNFLRNQLCACVIVRHDDIMLFCSCQRLHDNDSFMRWLLHWL
jgi:hypothetical protein